MAWIVLKHVNSQSPQYFHLFKDGFKTIDEAYKAIVDEEINLYKCNGILQTDHMFDALLEDIIIGEINDNGCCVQVEGASYEYYILRNKELTPFAFMCKIKNEINMEKTGED